MKHLNISNLYHQALQKFDRNNVAKSVKMSQTFNQPKEKCPAGLLAQLNNCRNGVVCFVNFITSVHNQRWGLHTLKIHSCLSVYMLCGFIDFFVPGRHGLRVLRSLR